MAIKQLRVTTLSSQANKKKTFSEAADGPFRSLQEVQTHLDSIKTTIDDLGGLIRQYQLQFARVQNNGGGSGCTRAAVLEFVVDTDAPKGPRKPRSSKSLSIDKIDKVVIPKIEVLRKNFSLVSELSDQVEELDKIYNSVAVNFRGVRGSNEMLKSIKMTQRTADSELQKALTFLGDVGKKHTPTPFRDLISATITYVSPELTFDSHKTFMYGYETDAGELAFAVYLELSGLTDDEDNIYPKFYIVFTCVLKENADKVTVTPVYYLTVMHDFATPGKYNLGKKISTPADASTALGMMLDLENINTAIGTRPHNLDPKKVTKNKFGQGKRVDTIKVDPNAVTFVLLKAVKAAEANEIAKSLYVDMKGLLTHIKGAKIKVKIFTDEGRLNIKFTLTNLAKGDQVSVNDIDFLKETFGLDDAKLRKVINVINSD